MINFLEDLAIVICFLFAGKTVKSIVKTVAKIHKFQDSRYGRFLNIINFFFLVERDLPRVIGNFKMYYIPPRAPQAHV